MGHNSRRRALSSSNYMRSSRGGTLLELLVTLVILSILASIALPYAELTVKRDREIRLRQTLRDVRSAIDEFHSDWKSGRVTKSTRGASDDGYPRSLDVLVDGVESAKADGSKIYYLRSLPVDPFAEATSLNSRDMWSLRGYQDAPDRIMWNGKDVYDIHSRSREQAIDGTPYSEW